MNMSALMNRLTALFACFSCVALIAACGGGEGGSSGTAGSGSAAVPASTPALTPTPTPAPTQATPSGSAATPPAAQVPEATVPPVTPLALAKKAAASAPTAVASIPTRAGPAPTLLESGATPSWPYQRYWISGDGRNNGSGTTADNPRLDTVAFIYNFSKWAKRPTGTTNNLNDGSRADYWTTSADHGGSQAYIGIRTNSRYVAMPSETFCLMSLIVDGRMIVPGVDYTANNQYAVWDLGTNETRNLVFVGSPTALISEVVIEDGATIAPYDFTVDQPVTISFTGDSYLGHQAIEQTGLTFVDMQARLLGAVATTATHVGGTGYRADIDGDVQTRASSPERLARFTEAKPTIMIVELGINDPWPGSGPTTVESMKTLLQGARAANPNSVLVAVGPWEPNESDAREPNGQDVAVMNAISATVEALPGPWIVLDNIRGSWKTSNGTSRGSLRGPWQTGEGKTGSPTGIGNGDTWLNSDGVHPTTPAGITGLAEVLTTELRAALASM
ncbi:MAG TPA: SGNH/GDSL hydrolase family protein [Variovorax sp.]|nr:SGNH/GDSL hydrolase family protein [Variovorax sp.]